ncbi:hypothetical protein D3C85_928580 [compost metagenome]
MLMAPPVLSTRTVPAAPPNSANWFCCQPVLVLPLAPVQLSDGSLRPERPMRQVPEPPPILPSLYWVASPPAPSQKPSDTPLLLIRLISPSTDDCTYRSPAAVPVGAVPMFRPLSTSEPV